jgi:hypothetical protein
MSQLLESVSSLNRNGWLDVFSGGLLTLCESVPTLKRKYDVLVYYSTLKGESV